MWREAVFVASIVAAAAPADAPDEGRWSQKPNSFQNEPARSGACLREGAKIVGSTPVQVGPKAKMPRKIRDVRPKYPDLPPGTVATMGPWVGEFLIDRDGNVAQIWTIREVKLTPPFPKFNQAILDAVVSGSMRRS